MGKLTAIVAKLLTFTRGQTDAGANVSVVKLDPGGVPTSTANHYAGAGDDSYPLATDYPLAVPLPGAGRWAVVAYLDPLNAGKAAEGERRVYARDADGAAVVDLWLKADGSATLSNENGTFTLAADGSQSGSNNNGAFSLEAGGNFTVNGVTIDTAGNITTSGTVSGGTVVQSSNNVTLGTHKHPPDNTPPTPGT